MNLSDNHFSGSLPVSLGQLHELAHLNLSNNILQDTVPDMFGNLMSLSVLDLSYNKLSGPIPTSLANLTYLTSLNLSFNKFIGRIPDGGIFSNITLQSLMGNTALCGLSRLGFLPCPNNEQKSRSSKLWLLKFMLPLAVILE